MRESKSAGVVDKLGQSVSSMRRPEVAYIIEGQKCPEQIKFNSDEEPRHANHRL